MEFYYLDGSIQGLEALLERGIAGERIWGEFWGQVKAIGASFREVRYPRREDRDAAWNRFQGIISRAKDQREVADRERAERKVEWEHRQSESAAAAQRIRWHIREAEPLNWLGQIFDGLAGGLAGVDRREARQSERDTLQRLNSAHREAWASFTQEKGSLTRDDKSAIFAELTDQKERIEVEWEIFKRR